LPAGRTGTVNARRTGRYPIVDGKKARRFSANGRARLFFKDRNGKQAGKADFQYQLNKRRI